MATGVDAAVRARRVPVRLLVRLAIVAAVVGAFWAWQPDDFKTIVHSPRALLKIGALVAAWIVFSRLLTRFVRVGWARTVVLAVPAALFLWWALHPYFTEKKVVEALPGTTVTAPTAPSPPTGAPANPAVTTTVPAPASTTPVKLTSGRLSGIGHRASGEAALYRLTDGSLVVRLEAIDVQNGPDYHVYLLSGTNRRNPSGGTELGKLKGNLGSQNYAVPAGLDVSGPQTVLIWCRAFSTPVANATQSPV